MKIEGRGKVMRPYPRVSKTLRLVCLGHLVFSLLVSPVKAQTELVSTSENAQDSHRQNEILNPVKAKLSPTAAEVARLIGVAPLLKQLENMQDTDRTAASTVSHEALVLRQEITESVLSVSLEVDGVIAEIDSEIAQASEVRAYLESRRDRALGINAIAGIFTGGGMGVASSLLQLGQSTNKLGNSVGAASGGISAVLSVLGIRQQHGGQKALGVAPNMLAKIFDRPMEFHSDYPEEVWSYLNSVPPGETSAETRRARLIRQWIELGRLDPPDTEKGRRKIDFLTSSISSQRALTIDLLADRAAMLAEVRSRVALMKRDLSKLMLSLRSRPKD